MRKTSIIKIYTERKKKTERPILEVTEEIGEEKSLEREEKILHAREESTRDFGK